MADFFAGIWTAPPGHTDPNSLEEWWKRRRKLNSDTAAIMAEQAAYDRQERDAGRGKRGGGGAIGKAFAASVAHAASRARMARAAKAAAAAKQERAVTVSRQAEQSAAVARAHSVDAVARKSAIAGGAQSAVVKLASYASGKSRMGALGQYLSREGTIELETENGCHLAGAEAVSALTERWSETSAQRQPSTDILMYRLEDVPARSQAAIAAALGESLAGHKFAWRSQESGKGVRIDVVMTAASSARGEGRKAERVFDNQKSLAKLEQRLVQRFGEGTQFEDRGFSHGVEGAARYMSRLTKGGAEEAHLSDGSSVHGHEANLQVAKGWKRDMRSREQRDVAHVILSAKPGTDREAFVDAARATLQRTFGEREYVFALHEDRNHLHVHAMVRLTDRHGEKLDPKVQDFWAWRQTFAEEARQRHIQMEATSRFETANPPGYKLKDIRGVERGTATESARRRVEAVRTHAVHKPTRPEGIERARAVAGEWRQVNLVQPASPAQSGLRAAGITPPAEGVQRLYRFERQGASASGAPIFTADRGTAEKMAARGAGQLVYLDIAKDRLSELRPSNRNPGRDYVLTPAMARGAKPHELSAKSKILHFRARAEEALASAGERQERASLTQASAGTPAPAEGVQRLYRFERQGAPTSSAPIFTADRGTAEKMAARGPGQLVHLDIAKDRLAELTPSVKNPDRAYVVTPAMAREAKPYSLPAENRDIHERAGEGVASTGERQERASRKHQQPVREDGTPTLSEGPRNMPYSQNMVEGREEIVKHLDQLEKAAASLPEEGQAEFRKFSKEYLENWDKGTEAAREREGKIGQIEGEGFSEPKPREYDNFSAYANQQRGEHIVYAHKREDGAAGKTAFVDTGQNIKVEDWRDRETNLAALQLASEKWESITVGGPERYQIATIKLAAEFGFKIANREWQDLYQQERERLAERAGQQAGLSAGEPVAGERAQHVQPQADAAQRPAQESQAPVAAQTPKAPQTQPVEVQGEGRRQAALMAIREQVDREAIREQREATIAEVRHEAPSDTGYVSQSEAASAREVERTVDSNPNQQMTVTLATSPEIERLAERQQSVLREGEVAQAQQREAQEEQAAAQAEKGGEAQAEKTEAQRERPRGQRQ